MVGYKHMTGERLSKLQTWILKECYKTVDGEEYIAMKKVDIFRFYKSSYCVGDWKFPIVKLNNKK